jgi:uroporphyrin-III C-methyltransferase / precorrin-2 dehydrogenase / sirohydrochlorin ferrochelatase
LAKKKGEQSKMYPVMLNVHNRRCLVVGGGGVALRKVEGLLSDGALVTVIAPDPIKPLNDLAEQGSIELIVRKYLKKEAGGFVLVFAATDDSEVNQRVFEDAQQAGIWVNVADDPKLCSFHLPARLKRGALQLAVASAGEAPFVVRRLRKLLENRFGPEWSEWVEAAGGFRELVRQHDLSAAQQERAFNSFFDATVDKQNISARVPSPTEESSWLRDDIRPPESSKEYSKPVIEPRLSRPALGKPSGFVSLVGGGPGDPGLLTLRGRQRLMSADTVVYDRLAATALPCDLPARVELHSVGKQAKHHPVPQSEITSLLIRLAQEGKQVVRLKGGDPYVFGRGGEEAEALAEASIPFEVVPSVTAAIAVPAYAGIPVTYRKEVVRVTLVTAHESIKDAGPQVRWDLLAADPHATLVGYMGVTSLPQVVEQLLQAGMNSATPAAMVERGTTSRQRVVRSTLGKLPDTVTLHRIRPPALFVIGPCVEHADKLDWYSKRPLLGERIVMVSPGGDIGEALSLHGVEVVQVPLPITPAARIVMGALPLTGCVFRSRDEVDALDEERDAPGWEPRMIAWCLDAATAQRARQIGWTRVEEISGPAFDQKLIAALEQASQLPKHRQ